MELGTPIWFPLSPSYPFVHFADRDLGVYDLSDCQPSQIATRNRTYALYQDLQWRLAHGRGSWLEDKAISGDGPPSLDRTIDIGRTLQTILFPRHPSDRRNPKFTLDRFRNDLGFSRPACCVLFLCAQSGSGDSRNLLYRTFRVCLRP